MSPVVAHRLNIAFLALALMVLVAIFLSCALWIGKSLGRQEAAREFALRPIPTRAAPASALTQWTCEPQEFREHLHACKGRIRLGKVGG